MACKNNNIDMNTMNNIEIQEILQEQISKREIIIQICIRMGQTSGEIVEKYQLAYRDKEKCDELKEKILKQYNNILSLCKELGINIEDVLERNIQKVNSRYDKNGKAVKSLES